MTGLALWLIRIMSLILFGLVCVGVASTLHACTMGHVVIGLLFVVLGFVAGVGYPVFEKKLAAKFKLYS